MNRLAAEGRDERSGEDGLAADLLETSLSWISRRVHSVDRAHPLNAPILAPGGTLAPVLRFQPYNAYYESMMAAIHIVWAVMLWRASDDPAEHPLFLDFTIWASVAHGVVMLIATPIAKGLVMTFVEGLPLFVIAAVLRVLRPRSSSADPVSE